jgi:predicted nucleic acid-binding protein
MSSSVVLDNSALVMALTDVDPIGIAVRARLRDVDSMNAPTLLDYELHSALFGMRRGGKLNDVEVRKAINAYKLLDVIQHRTFDFWQRVQELSHNLSAYDAQYVALAEALGLPLITCDARIARSGAAKCPVEVFA